MMAIISADEGDKHLSIMDGIFWIKILETRH